MNRIKRMLTGAGAGNAAASLIAIAIGLVFGLIILLISNPSQAFQGLGVIIAGGLNGGMKGIGNVLYYATPLILTGLSVGFAFKTGLFNIGASGQLIVGGFVAIFVAHNLSWIPSWLLWVVALTAAMLAGALWGAIPGLFKSLLNVHEVIACIMCNYIGMYGVNFLIKNSNIYESLENQTVDVGQAAVPGWGLDKIFYNLKGRYLDTSSVNGGILIAIGIAILIYIVLNKTAFGYELKACGYNRDASRYAGINEKRSILLSMVIAGGLAGIGGGLLYLVPPTGLHIHVVEVLAAQGFNGIPVALLGLSNPIGIVFSGLFIAHIGQGGYYLQKLNYMPEIIDMIIAMIIYFSAFALIIRNVIADAMRQRKVDRDQAGAGAQDASGDAAEAETERTEEVAEHE